MMKNVCLIGCGKMAASHAAHLKNKVNLYFQSSHPEKAKTYQKRYDGKGIFHSWQDAIDTEWIDALIICTPPHHHAEIIIQALRGGKLMMVEKPLCATREELERIEGALTHEQALSLMVAENYYYKPSLKKIRKILEENKLGTLQSVHLKRKTKQVNHDWRAQFGALLEGGIHFVAFLSGIVEDEPFKVEAHFPYLFSSQKKGNSPETENSQEKEKTSVLELRYPQSIQASLIYSWETPALPGGIFQHSRIDGSAGSLFFESNGLYLMLHAQEKKLSFLPGGRKDLSGTGAMLDDFLNALHSAHPRPQYNFLKAKRDLNIVFQAYEQIHEK